MTYSWTTLPNGQISANNIVLMPSAQEMVRFDTDVMRWSPLASVVSAESGVPTPWLLGVIAAESFGNPNAGSGAGAVGLMQLLPQYHFVGQPREQWYDPLNNIRAGAKYLASMRAKGSDLVYAAAEYNVGHVAKNDSVWGLYAQGCPPTPGLPNCYITRVVYFANYATDKLGMTETSSAGVALGGVALLFGLAAVGYVGWKSGYYEKLRAKLRK
jgi:hypothetical protein